MSFGGDTELSAFSDDVPKILVCGLPRSGKSSIIRVVFGKTSPHETAYLEPTTMPEVRHVANHLAHVKIVDVPSTYQLDRESEEEPTEQDKTWFSKTVAIVFVIDSLEDNWHQALLYARRVVRRAIRVNPNIVFQVFYHKIDSNYRFDGSYSGDGINALHGEDISDAYVKELQASLDEDLYRNGCRVAITWHCTSIYDHSVFDCFSRLLQQLSVVHPHGQCVEQLLDSLVSNCRMERAYLFDIVSKVYLASDSGFGGGDSVLSYELMSDMLDVIIDTSCIYGIGPPRNGKNDSRVASPRDAAVIQQGAGPASLAINSASSCTISLSNGLILYMKEVDTFLALVCQIKEEYFDRTFLVDHNINKFKESLAQVLGSSPTPTQVKEGS